MPKQVRVGLIAFVGTLLFLKIFVLQSWLTAVIGGLLVAGIAGFMALRLPHFVKAGMLAGLTGVIFVLSYGTEHPAVAIIAGMLSGLGAALLASYYDSQSTTASGIKQGALAGLIAGLFTTLASYIVWLFVAQAAGLSNQEFARELEATVPLSSLLRSDVTIMLWLSVLTLVASVITGLLAGAARAQPGKRGNFLLYGVIALTICVLPLLDTISDLQLLGTIIPIYVFILLALGLNIVVGYAGLLDLGYAAFFAIGAYTTGMLSSPHLGININFWLVIWIAAGVAAIAGLILGAPTLPLRGDYLAIVTLGFGEIVPVLFRNFGGGGSSTVTLKFFNYTLINQKDLTGGTAGISPINPPRLPGIAFTPQNKLPWYFLIVGIMALTIFLINRLRDSRQGRAWTALREDELAADAMGINIIRTKLLAFAMGATFSGFAGAFYGAFIGAIFPSSFEFSVSIIVLCMVILGGMGNMVGVMVGGLLIMGADRLFLPEAANLIRKIAQTTTGSSDIAAYQDLTQLRLLLFGLVLVVMMLVRPEGLIPSQRVRAELHPDSDQQLEQMNSVASEAERDRLLTEQ